MSNPNPSHKFKPGQSGNPSGLPKETIDLRARLKRLTPKAIEILEAVLDADNIRLEHKVSVARFVIERCIPAETQASAATTEAQEDPIERLARVLVRENPEKKTNQEDLEDFKAVARASTEEK